MNVQTNRNNERKRGGQFSSPNIPITMLVLGYLAIAGLGVARATDLEKDSNVSGKTCERLIVQPESVELAFEGDQSRFVVQAYFSDGSSRDVTSAVRIEENSSPCVSIAGGRVIAVDAGESQITLEWSKKKTILPVKVLAKTRTAQQSFRNDILPVLTKAGCNTGKCHGAASGKDGFRLSLFGYDPDGDHFRLTREIPGRRINATEPEKSLIVTKALGEVPHTGGRRMVAGTDDHKTLVRWISSGAPADRLETAKPVRIEVLPHEAVFSQKDATQNLIVIAHYDDGTRRDVTNWSVFLSNNDATATVSEDGTITATGHGSGFIMARFDQFTEGTTIICRSGLPYSFPEIKPNNYIDELAFERWQQLHITPSDLCSDEVFLRRVYLDLIGLLPTTKEREEFISNPNPDKRIKLVERLLERPEFLDIWTMKWAEMLQIRTANGVSAKGLHLYDAWLRDKVRSGMTIDKIIAQLVPASGGTFDNPATAYYQTETTPQLLAENLAQSFLGTRIQCAQCHNHPFDRWTMDDYYGFAAFFSQVGYKQAKDPREITVYNLATGGVKHPVKEKEVAPKYLGGETPQVRLGDDYRDSLATWLTDPANKSFANNLGNVVWSHFFGIGIVEPVDDVRVSNPPSNRPLLDAIGHRLAESKFDIKPIIRDICVSRTYQLSTRTNTTNSLDERHFSHARIRRLRAEVLLDCINEVTGTRDKFPGLLPGSRAVQLADGRTTNYFLTTFGRASRATACSCEVSTSPTLSQALHLLNGETTSGKISEGGVVDSLTAQGVDSTQIVREIFQRCLTREPSVDELSAIKAKLQNSKDVKQEIADLFWAVLNSNEFIFNH